MNKHLWKCAILPLLLLLLSHHQAKAQFFKDLLNNVKQTAQGRANSKASQTTNQAIDKAENAGSPKPGSSTPPANQGVGQNTSTASGTAKGPTGSGSSTSAPGDKDSDSSFLSLSVSADRILSGGGILISGTSIRFGDMKDVLITVDGGVALSTNLPLTDSGHYQTYQIFPDAGEYKITVKSSNRKSVKTITIAVFDLADIDSITVKPRAEMQRAYDQVQAWIRQMKEQLAASDAKKLQDQMDQLTLKKDQTFKVFDDVGNIGKTLDKIQKQSRAGNGSGGKGSGGGGSTLSPELTKDLNKLSDGFSTEAGEMQAANDAAAHKSYDNTICEYIQMMSEACAAFSTVTAFFSGKGELDLGLASITKNIALDKGVSAAQGIAPDAAGSDAGTKALYQELGKYCAVAKFDADGLGQTLNKAGFTGDMVSMCSDFFLKKYCGTMSGDFSQDYECIYSNDNKVTWWEYTYHNEATINLRYLKSAATPTLIKMKGNIEGNATKFTIYQKPSEMDDFKKAMKDRAKIYSICLHVPPTAPMASSQADKSTNFGAVARAVVTPAYFNIPIDADYNPETGDLKIYCNEAIMDYGPLVEYTYGYICIAAGIPLTTRVHYPIVKAKLSIAKVIEKNNEFKVVQDADHNLSFSKQASFDLGVGGSITHHISMKVNAKSN